MKHPANQHLRRTKILATLGPATDAEGVLDDIVRAGVNVVRLNFSHGASEQHARRVEAVREVAARQGREVGVLADLQGPKIRIEKFDLASEALTGNVTGNFQPATRAFQATFQLDVTGKRLLPPDLQAKLTAPIRLTGTVDGAPDNLAFRDIRIASNLVAANFSGTLKSGTIDAAISGNLPDLAALQPNIAGSARLTATVAGPVATPAIKAEIRAVTGNWERRWHERRIFTDADTKALIRDEKVKLIGYRQMASLKPFG